MVLHIILLFLLVIHLLVNEFVNLQVYLGQSGSHISLKVDLLCLLLSLLLRKRKISSLNDLHAFQVILGTFYSLHECYLFEHHRNF